MHDTPAKTFTPINDYSLIGDCHSASLVSKDGSLDWCCLPRFDSASVFASLLDSERGGRFSITPQSSYTSMQRYVPETNVLQTEFSTPYGTCVLTDCMPLYPERDGSMPAFHQVIRRARCTRGSVELGILYEPRPDYARRSPSLQSTGDQVLCEWNDASLVLTCPTPLGITGDRAEGRVQLKEGQTAWFLLAYSDAASPTPGSALTAEQRLDATERFWREKAAAVRYAGPWRGQVVRSYLALHLLTYLPTGAIVAAPTTSLPEAIGGVRNWDYRYTWLRDAAFTIDALLSVGHSEEAMAFFRWLGEVCARYGDTIQIMYRVDEEDDLPEQELLHLRGYRDSTPVRIGNGAASQVQHDIYGEVLASAAELVNAGVPLSDGQWNLLRTLANLAAERWRDPDNGIWEVRGGPFHFVYSKVMCWVALDRAVKLARDTEREGAESRRWDREAQAIRDEVLSRGWSERKQAFVQHYGTEAMDASNLLIPIVGFLPADDPRVVSTVDRIRSELGHGLFLHRYRTEETDDGLAGSEGAFTLCSFWLVIVLSRMGRASEARDLFEQLLELGSPLGLFGEMSDPSTREALGNYPQAFTHIGLILAAMACGRTEAGKEG